MSNLYVDGQPVILPIAYSGGFENYSEEEVMIGRWIDGKPLYMKCFKVTDIKYNQDVSIPNSGIEKFNPISILGYLKTSYNSVVPIPRYLNESNILNIYFDPSKKPAYYVTGNYSNSEYIYIVTKYTKTTDNPLPLMPNGGFGEIYDDQERLIGSWFGEPLYRKVIHIESISGNSASSPYYLSEFPNIDKIVSSFATYDYEEWSQENRQLRVVFLDNRLCFFQIMATKPLNITNVTIVLEYTKTTY